MELMSKWQEVIWVVNSILNNFYDVFCYSAHATDRTMMYPERTIANDCSENELSSLC